MNLRDSLLAALVVGIATSPVHGYTKSENLSYAERPGGSLERPADDKALVIFLRESKRFNVISAPLYDGEEFLSIAMSRTYYRYRTDPGRHLFMVVSRKAEFLEADLAGGRIYFVLIQGKTGATRANFDLIPLGPAHKKWKKIPEWLDLSYNVTPNEQARKWADKNRESVLAKRSKFLPQWESKRDRPVLKQDDGVDSFP